MSKPTTSHPERTAAEPRQNGLHRTRICYIRNINPRVRLIRLALPYAIKFLPGQWLDVHIPSLANRVGGFTITSTPSDASDHPKHDSSLLSSHGGKISSTSRPYFELVIQNAPRNPPAAWLWNDEREILDQPIDVRVGGSFIWPPVGRRPRHALFVAGGVGIKFVIRRVMHGADAHSPLISMLSHLAQPKQKDVLPETIKLLYSTRLAGGSFDQVLFLPRLKQLFRDLNNGSDGPNTITLHITDKCQIPRQPSSGLSIISERLTKRHLIAALPPVTDRTETAAYVCGPPAMTDEFVSVLESQEGMTGNVFCEKWW